jgi:hypothetical protein
VHVEQRERLVRDDEAQHDESDRRAHIHAFRPCRNQTPQHETGGDDRERTGIEAVFQDGSRLPARHRDVAALFGTIEVVDVFGPLGDWAVPRHLGASSPRHISRAVAVADRVPIGERRGRLHHDHRVTRRGPHPRELRGALEEAPPRERDDAADAGREDEQYDEVSTPEDCGGSGGAPAASAPGLAFMTASRRTVHCPFRTAYETSSPERIIRSG